MISHLLVGEPHKIDVLTRGRGLFYLATGVGIIHISTEHHLQQHLREVNQLTVFTVGFNQWLNIQMFGHFVDNPNRMVLENHFFNGGWYKPILLLVVNFEFMIHISDYQYLKIGKSLQTHKQLEPKQKKLLRINELASCL